MKILMDIPEEFYNGVINKDTLLWEWMSFAELKDNIKKAIPVSEYHGNIIQGILDGTLDDLECGAEEFEDTDWGSGILYALDIIKAGKRCKSYEELEDALDAQDKLKKKDIEELLKKIDECANKQIEIGLAVFDSNERYTHIKMGDTYRHCKNIIKEYYGMED